MRFDAWQLWLPGVVFYDRSLQPGELPRPLARKEVQAFSHRRMRTSTNDTA